MDFVSKHWGNYEFYQLVKGYPGGVIVFAPNGDILEVNQAFATALGCPEENIYEHTYSGISDGESQSTEAEFLKTQAVQRGYTDVYEKKYRIGNHQPLIVQQHTVLIRDNAGQPQVFLAMLAPGPRHTAEEGKVVISVGDDPTEELVFLRNQNTELQTLLKKAQENSGSTQLQKELASLTAKNDNLKDELSQVKESEVQLSRKVSALTTTLEWKDRRIAELEEHQGSLKKELREIKGELEVIRILESAEENPPENKADALPLPWEVAEMKSDDAPNQGDSLDENTEPVGNGTAGDDAVLLSGSAKSRS
ncbi:MAG: PAS domain-containing protein [Deltaproteobacteria bacterium]|nr:PAS domain-containing protein [Deltaproteobacteria bacterium]